MSLQIDHLTVSIGGSVTLDDINLKVPAGSLFGLLGPSGCGKSTLLKTIAGLIRQDQGEIRWGEQVIDDLAPEKRGMTMVFQDLRLFPHLSVRDNVAFPLKMAGVSKQKRHQQAADMLAMVKMKGLEDRRAHQLSGGQQQRVVLARALVARPRVLLLDEPFSSLDERLRAEMRTLVRELHQTLGTTMILVTHDRLEAMAMSDAMAVMAPGRILQAGAPQALYDHPDSLAVARQLIPGTVIAGNAVDGRFTGGGLDLSLADRRLTGAVTALLPRESIRIQPGSGSFRIEAIQFAGDHREVILSNGAISLTCSAPPDLEIRVSEPVDVAIRPDAVHFFPHPSTLPGQMP